MFGYAPGSFSWAAKRGKPGYFEQAHEGTIFLDEIGRYALVDSSQDITGSAGETVYAGGGTKIIPVDVRIIAATNRNLREAMSRGEFREDLYYGLMLLSFIYPTTDAPGGHTSAGPYVYRKI